MAQLSQRLLPVWYSVKPSILCSSPKFVQRWGPKHYSASVEIMRPLSTKLLVLIRDRYVFN